VVTNWSRKEISSLMCNIKHLWARWTYTSQCSAQATVYINQPPFEKQEKEKKKGNCKSNQNLSDNSLRSRLKGFESLQLMAGLGSSKTTIFLAFLIACHVGTSMAVLFSELNKTLIVTASTKSGDGTSLSLSLSVSLLFIFSSSCWKCFYLQRTLLGYEQWALFPFIKFVHY
jgi:hypothetical protein